MSFFSDALRVLGAITAPVLVASGVGAPLGIAIGVAATAGTSVAANEIDRARENAELDRRAAEEKQRANERLEDQRRAEKERRDGVERDLRKQQEQAELPGRALEACRTGDMANLPSIVKKLTNEQFEKLSLSLLAECPNADIREKVLQMIGEENIRRFT